MSIFWLLLLTILLLSLSAFFSGSEAAFFSLASYHKTEQPKIKQLLASPQRLLATIIFGNLTVNTSATAIFTLFLINFAHTNNLPLARVLGIGGVIMTTALLLVGELSPKIFAARKPLPFARFASPIITIFQTLLTPFTFLLTKLTTIFTFIPQEKPQLSDEELHTMVEIGKEQGIFSGGEEEILRNLIDFDKRTVSEVMTPRSEIVAVPSTATIAQALSFAQDAGFSRLPVYEGNIDDIIGIVYVKELLTAPNPEAKVTTEARLPYFIPEVKRLLPLLNELRRKNSHIAVVVDEFGQTAGLVTLEDLLEAIFGEIADEFDLAEELPYQKLNEDKFLVDGEIDLATLNHLFDNAFAAVQFDRLSTFIHDYLGRLPTTGDKIEFRSLEIFLIEVTGRKIEKVLIVKKHK